MRNERKTLLIIGLLLVVGGFIVAMYREPIYEVKNMWKTPIGRLVDTPCNNCEHITISATVGSYQPYDWIGWPALGLGVVILVSAASVKVMK